MRAFEAKREGEMNMATGEISLKEDVLPWLETLLTGVLGEEYSGVTELREREWTRETLRAHLTKLIDNGLGFNSEARIYARIARAALDSEVDAEHLRIIAMGNEGFYPPEMRDRALSIYVLEDVRAMVPPLLERMGGAFEEDLRELRRTSLPTESIPSLLRRIAQREWLPPEALALVMFARRATRSPRDFQDFRHYAERLREHLERQ
jgi:hypothetical protein